MRGTSRSHWRAIGLGYGRASEVGRIVFVSNNQLEKEMAFPDSLIKRVRTRAHNQCCICEQVGIVIHHIIPQREEGPDIEDNAAPLCPSCHDTYEYNPKKRNLIRERRETWYKICSNRETGGPELAEFSMALQNLPSKEDIERLAFRNASYVLGRQENQLSLEQTRFSFTREEFVHPLIIRELSGWISDAAETITGIDLASANRSNRFFGGFRAREFDGKLLVEWKGDQGEFFIYSYIGTSPSGVEIVECFDCGGGSGVFGSVGMFSLELDRALSEDENRTIFTRNRTVLKCLGWITLGDRYDGEVSYKDGLLKIGADRSHFKHSDTPRLIPIQ